MIGVMDNQNSITPEPNQSNEPPAQPTSTPAAAPQPEVKKRPSLTIDLRIICFLLVAVIAAMLIMWQPWKNNAANAARKITVNGSATIKAEPDSFLFSPSYERNTTDEITALSKEITTKLKELGIDEGDIKTNVNRYDDMAEPTSPEKETSYLMIDITTDNKDIAQKVQDYLLTTNPTGSITPYPTFSKDKEKELKSKAQADAVKNAREEAEKIASGLEAKVGKVAEIKDSEDMGLMPYMSASLNSGLSQSLEIQPGEEEYEYRISVTFELK